MCSCTPWYPALVQSQSCLIPSNYMDCSMPGFPVSLTISQSLLKFMPIESVMLSNYLILCLPLLLWPSIFSSTRVFSNESALHIRWPKNIIRDKEGHFMILKISIHQENIIALNVYDLNNRDSKYTKLTNYKKK